MCERKNYDIYKNKTMEKMMKKRNLIVTSATIISVIFILLSILAKKMGEDKEIDNGNIYLDIFNVHSTSRVFRSDKEQNFYEKYGKRVLDKILSFVGLLLCAPCCAVIGLIIFLDDPGPIFFSQKRVGKDKKFIWVHKFRTMLMSAPHEVPTHQFDNPEQYITRVGKCLRKYSLDELPQLWDIFMGKMSIIGPRPALWNQKDLIEEREKYGANSVMPGLTGWAQINGRDELNIAEKARFDGEYVKYLHSGSLRGISFDLKCLFGTILSVIRSDGVVEGNSGTKKQVTLEGLKIDSSDVGFEEYGCNKLFHIDRKKTKRVLITGAGSYIGESFFLYAAEHYPNINVETVDVVSDLWKEKDFSLYDVVFHVAGIAHADVRAIREQEKKKYYDINTKLAVEVCKKCKKSGVKQFILMSSIIIYGNSAPYSKYKTIDQDTLPNPTDFYGDSKWQADKAVRKIGDKNFHVAVIRAPMIYGKGSKGNYPILANIANKLPIFPEVKNQRSMLYIDNLCEFLSLLILSGEGGVYFPQNREYSNTSDLVKEIAKVNGKRIKTLKLLKIAVKAGCYFPGTIGRLTNKAFGNMVYNKKLSKYQGLNYQVVEWKESIKNTENNFNKEKRVLIVTSVASMVEQFHIADIKFYKNQGFGVDVATNFIKGSTCSKETIEKLLKDLDKMEVGCYQVDFERKSTNIKADIKALNQLDKIVKGVALPVNGKKSDNSSIKKGKNYILIHSHSPIGGAVGRIIAKRNHIKIIYMAHGFHFYKGAPRKNWLLYYPIEKELSRITDVLITINQEDYKRAKKEFKAKKIVYIPGVGIDVEKFQIDKNKGKMKREELGLKDRDIMLFSIGELNQNKNHQIVVKALGKIQKLHPELSYYLHYYIAGKGEEYNKLIDLAKEWKVNLHLLGYRNDIAELLKAADIFLLPSKREGLNVGLMEAMASGLPCIVSDIRGNQDLIVEKKGGYKIHPDKVWEWAFCIEDMLTSDYMDNLGKYNQQIIKKYSRSIIEKKLKKIIESLC